VTRSDLTRQEDEAYQLSRWHCSTWCGDPRT